jgi:hypothetical protein
MRNEAQQLLRNQRLDLLKAMKRCQQTEGQSVLAHGVSVWYYTKDLLHHLKYGSELRFEWKLPTWIHDYKKEILDSLPPESVLQLANVLHDCGKPYCIEIDAEGKRHFPNHVAKSKEIFESLFSGVYGAETISSLIANDMTIHTLKADGVEEFSKLPLAVVHLLIGLTEIHSNAKMFGGIESTSFKIKWKSIDKRGSQVLEKIFGKRLDS